MATASPTGGAAPGAAARRASSSAGVGFDGEPTLQERLVAAGENGPDTGSGSEPTLEDPVSLFLRLEASGRFHRDTGLGRIFHPGKLSFRENVPTNSLHLLVKANRVSAHVDLVSPLGLRAGATSRYAVGRVAAHNVVGLASALLRLVRGRQGDHRCELDCEWARTDPTTNLRPHPDAGPWSVQVEARVAGRLDAARLGRALHGALGAGADSLAVCDCADDADLNRVRTEFQSVAVPLEERPPVRVLLARHRAGDVVMLNVNHAAADGFGALGVLRALGRAYAGDEPAAPALEFLALADLPVRPSTAPLPVWMRRYLGVVERLRNLLGPPAQVMQEEATSDPGSGFHLVTLPLAHGEDQDPRHPPTLHGDFLLAGLHRAIGAWNAAHDEPGGRVSILAPADLRPPDWPEEAIGNFSVTARISTRRRHRGSLAAALAQVSVQTTRNNRSRSGTALIGALDRAGLVPLWTRQSMMVLEPLTRNRLVDTALLCDLGRIDPPSFGTDAGETTEVWFSAPARDPLDLCMGAVTLDGVVHLVMRYPCRLFSPEAARSFAGCFLAELEPVTPAAAGADWRNLRADAAGTWWPRRPGPRVRGAGGG